VQIACSASSGDREGHRHGCGEHRDGRLDASMLDTATTVASRTDEGARAFVLADRMDEIVHPGRP